MKKDLRFYLKLFTSTFYLSAFTFGGGFVIISLMKKKFVDEYHWIEEKEMLDLTAIAQSSPGAIAVNASILVGYRLAGVTGALLTILGTVLPPLIVLSVISVAYTAFRDSLIVKYILRGMQAGVAAVIIDVVISMVISLVKDKKAIPIMVMIGAFAANFIFQVNVIVIILICGVIGIISMRYYKSVGKSGDIK
jgi:chromate transporter